MVQNIKFIGILLYQRNKPRKVHVATRYQLNLVRFPKRYYPGKFAKEKNKSKAELSELFYFLGE